MTAFLLVLGPTLAGCAVAPADFAVCSGKVANVHQSNGTPSAMDAKAYDIQCNRVVELDGYVEIRKLVKGTWIAKKRSYFHITTVPNKKEVRMVATKCKKGTYEPYLSITGNYKGDIEHLNYEGRQSHVTCKKR